MSGDVGIEGRLSNTNTDAGIMEFKAYNTDPITLFSVKEFERFAFDQRNLRLFSSCIADIFKAGPASSIPKTGEFEPGPVLNGLSGRFFPVFLFRFIESSILNRLPVLKAYTKKAAPTSTRKTERNCPRVNPMEKGESGSRYSSQIILPAA